MHCSAFQYAVPCRPDHSKLACDLCWQETASCQNSGLPARLLCGADVHLGKLSSNQLCLDPPLLQALADELMTCSTVWLLN